MTTPTDALKEALIAAVKEYATKTGINVSNATFVWGGPGEFVRVALTLEPR